MTGPMGRRVVVSPLRAMSIIMPPFGGHVHIEYHNHSVRANFARLGILRRIAAQRRSLTVAPKAPSCVRENSLLTFDTSTALPARSVRQTDG